MERISTLGKGMSVNPLNSIMVSPLILTHLFILICLSHGSDQGKLDGKVMEDHCSQRGGVKSSALHCRADPSRSNIEQQNENPSVMAENEGYIVMVLSTDGDLSDLKRAIEDLRKMVPTCPIAISVPQIQQDYRELTSFNDIHFIDNRYDSLISPFSSYAQKTLSLLSNFSARKYLGWGKKAICYVPNHAKNTIHILETSRNHSKMVEYKFSAKDEETQNEVAFGDSRYNPNFQKILASKEEEESGRDNSVPEEINTYQSRDSKSLLNRGKCKHLERLRDSFSNLQDKFPFFKYVLIINPQKHFSSSLIRYFLKTSEIYDIDPSVYSISAHNPLEISGNSPHEGQIARVDRFLYGGMALLPKRIVKEIVTQFHVPLHPGEKDLPHLPNHDPMDPKHAFVMYVKMISLDDDLSLHLILKDTTENQFVKLSC